MYRHEARTISKYLQKTPEISEMSFVRTMQRFSNNVKKANETLLQEDDITRSLIDRIH